MHVLQRIYCYKGGENVPPEMTTRQQCKPVLVHGCHISFCLIALSAGILCIYVLGECVIRP